MMKAILKTGEELQINSAFPISDTQINISFKGITKIDDLLDKLTVSALKQISIYSEDSVTIYSEYTQIKNPSATKAEDGTWDVLITFEREDEIAMKINSLLERQSLVEDVLNETLLG